MNNNSNPVYIKGQPVGDGCPAVFLAEINSAFDTDMEQGQRMIRSASEAGADFLKAEILCSTDIVLNDGSRFEYEYGDNGERTSETWYDIVARKVNPLSFYESLFEYSRSLNLEFIVSVYDLASVEFLADMQAAALKIPSSNLNHEPLIVAAAKTSIPLILDTNKAYTSDIARALLWCEQQGNSNVVLNHHPGSGPAPAEQHNLNYIRHLKQTFGVPVGLSCHYVGDEILYAALGAGANLLEKPISFDPSHKDLDTVFAANIDDLPSILAKVRACSAALGDGKPRAYMPDRELDQWMGVIAQKDITPGDKLTTDNCRFSWPCKGISVEDWSKIEGRTVVHDIFADHPVRWGDVSFD